MTLFYLSFIYFKFYKPANLVTFLMVNKVLPSSAKLLQNERLKLAKPFLPSLYIVHNFKQHTFEKINYGDSLLCLILRFLQFGYIYTRDLLSEMLRACLDLAKTPLFIVSLRINKNQKMHEMNTFGFNVVFRMLF